jgi:hypothetical protein
VTVGKGQLQRSGVVGLREGNVPGRQTLEGRDISGASKIFFSPLPEIHNKLVSYDVPGDLQHGANCICNGVGYAIGLTIPNSALTEDHVVTRPSLSLSR